MLLHKLECLLLPQPHGVAVQLYYKIKCVESKMLYDLDTKTFTFVTNLWLHCLPIRSPNHAQGQSIVSKIEKWQIWNYDRSELLVPTLPLIINYGP